jgi:FkbM family methyltransferase
LNVLSQGYWRIAERLSRHRRKVRSRGLTFSLQCNNPITYYRWDSYNTKEPETLDWIDRNVKNGDVVFDIGANIGLYTVYTLFRHPQARVVAFEPEYANLHLLRDNIVENGLQDRATLYPLALSDRSGPSMLHIQDLTPGAALSTEAAESLTVTKTGHRVVAREGTYAMTLDRFCGEAQLQPNCIKIDVDGTEPAILAGAEKTLANPALRSLIIELPDDAAAFADCTRRLGSAGLELQWKTDGCANQIWHRPGGAS